MIFEHITIEGASGFQADVATALLRLRRTASWQIMACVTAIKQCDWGDDNAAAYATGTWICLLHGAMGHDSRWLAGVLAHEAFHVSRGCATGKVEERAAFAAQETALKQIGAREHLATVRQMARGDHHRRWAASWGFGNVAVE